MKGTARTDQVWRSMDEDDVIRLAKQGSGEATEFLLRKYQGLVEAKAKSYFLMGAEREDVIQEGMIGLFKAIRDFSMHRFGGFRKFAALCVTRQIISAVKCASRQKHHALNSYVSVDASLPDADEDGMLEEVLAEEGEHGPDTAVIGRELQRRVALEMERSLSELEREVLQEYLRGHSYRDIADGLGTNVKQVDNALQRAKKKLEEYVPLGLPTA
ncbi:MAG TPA: RNA polymerase sporulation sigma factor SigH [Armatimonadetes bacterium]|nr:RNA polymerase sporulation sigma factor SigH [Armatimonadota bacterium]